MSFKSFVAKLNRRDTPLFPRVSKTFKVVSLTLLVIAVAFFTVRVLAADSDLKTTVDGMKAGGALESWLGKDTPRINTVGVLNLLVDVNTISPSLLSGVYPKDGRFFASAPGGVIGSTSQMIASLYNQPASGIEYIAEVKDSFLGKPAYAQGYGFTGLQPILPIWRVFRNVVYILSSFIFIIIGIMIMLRVKISPQTIISLQNSIPNLITALILVTFSYAIAGLLIDCTYVFLSLILSILFASQGKSLGENLFSPNLFTGIAGFVANPFNFGNLSQAGLLQTLKLLVIPTLVSSMIGGLMSFIVGFAIALPLTGNLAGGLGMGALFGSVGYIIMAIVLFVMIIIWLFKFLLGVFKCYATIIIKIVLAPLEIGMGAFPNSKVNFDSWLLEVVANLAVFPVSFLFLVIANMIICNILWGGVSGSLTDVLSLFTNGTVPYTGMWTPQILGGDVTQIALAPIGGISAMAIGISTLLILSKLPEMIPQYIFMIKPSEWGKAIGEAGAGAINSPFTLAGRGINTFETYNKGRQAYYEAERSRQQLPGKVPTSAPQKENNQSEVKSETGSDNSTPTTT